MNKDITSKIQRIKDYTKLVCECLQRNDPVQAMALTVEMGGHCRRLANDFQQVIWARQSEIRGEPRAQTAPAGEQG